MTTDLFICRKTLSCGFDNEWRYEEVAPYVPQEWQPIETAPRDGKFYLFGTTVIELISRTSRFEMYILRIDEDGELRTQDGYYFSDWEYDEFTHWKPIDAPKTEGG